MDKIIFLFLSLISGAVEIGGVLYAIKIKLSIMEIVGIGLAYQIGNLVPNPLKIDKKFTLISAAISTVCFTTCSFITFNYWVFFVGYIFAAMSIQSLRSLQKENVSTTVKRTFRILGFILAPFASTGFCSVVGLVLTAIAASTKWPFVKTEVIKPRVSLLSFVMIVHQIHYFSYAYFIVIILAAMVKSPVIIGLLFVLGWFTYTSVSHALKKDTFIKYLVFGHIFLAFVLYALACNSGNMAAAVLWILTGFGGGTVFCIGKINKITQDLSKSDIVFSENIGHIIGVILGMGAFIVSGQTNYPVFLSSISAAATVVLVLIYANVRMTGASIRDFVQSR